MANEITGMIKVLKQNFLVNNAVTITASSGSDDVSNIKDFDRSSSWNSNGSDDTVEESLEITFTTTLTINRLLLLIMNWASFNIQYWTGSVWADFTNVWDEISINEAALYGSSTYGNGLYSSISSVTGIHFAGNTETSKYFEFDAVSTTKIRIQIQATITANQEKTLTELYIGSEIGTFIEDITSSPNSYSPVLSDTRSIYITKSNGGTIKYERGDKYRSAVNISELLETDDQNIINTMYSDGQFAILPCGGVPYTQQGWRLQDFFHVIIRGNQEAQFAIGRVAAIGLNYSFDLLEQ